MVPRAAALGGRPGAVAHGRGARARTWRRRCMRRGVARCAVDPRLQARHEFEVLWREAKMGANGSDTPGSIPLVKLAGAIDAEELVFTQLGKTMGEDAQTFANLCTAAAAAADAMCAPAAGVEGGAVNDRGDRAPGALQWLRALSSIVREALRLDIHSQGSDAGESWQTLTLHSLLERGVGTSAAVALLLVAVADDVASRRPEWESLRLSAAPLADGSLSYWLVWCADAPAFVLDAYEGEVLMLGDLEAFMAPFAGEWGEEEVWFTNANGGVRLGEAQLEEHYRGGDSGDEVEGEVGPSSDADASEDADAEAGMGADDDRPLAVEQRWLLAAVLIALRDRYFGLATQVKQKSDHARPMLPLIGPAPEGAALTTEYQQEALNRAISASERLRMVAYDDAAVARDNGLLLSHANRGWEAISELEEWKRRGAYASEAADRVLLVQERLRLMRRERRLARKRRRGQGGPEVGN